MALRLKPQPQTSIPDEAELAAQLAAAAASQNTVAPNNIADAAAELDYVNIAPNGNVTEASSGIEALAGSLGEARSRTHAADAVRVDDPAIQTFGGTRVVNDLSRFAPVALTNPQANPRQSVAPFTVDQAALDQETQAANALNLARNKRPSQPFQLRYPNPQNEYEQLANELAQAEYTARNPQNKDKGGKAIAREILSNLFEGLKMARPGMGLWESLALGGVGVGGGLINRGWNERREAERQIPMLQARLQQLNAEQEFNQKQQKSQIDALGGQIENERKLLALVNERLTKDPRWELVLKKEELNDADAKYFNQKLGINLPRSYWGGFIERIDPATGQLLTRPTKASPAYTPNVTVSPDRTVPPVDVVAAGQTFPVRPAEGLAAITQQEAGNIAREQAAQTQFENRQWEAAKTNAQSALSYAQALAAWNQALATTQASIGGDWSMASNIIEQMNAQTQNLRALHAQMQEAVNKGDVEGFENAQKQFNAATKEAHQTQNQFFEIQKKAGMSQAQLDALRKAMPAKPPTLKAVKGVALRNNTVNVGKTATMAEVEAFARDKGMPVGSAKSRLQNQGYKIIE